MPRYSWTADGSTPGDENQTWHTKGEFALAPSPNADPVAQAMRLHFEQLKAQPGGGPYLLHHFFVQLTEP